LTRTLTTLAYKQYQENCPTATMTCMGQACDLSLPLPGTSRATKEKFEGWSGRLLKSRCAVNSVHHATIGDGVVEDLRSLHQSGFFVWKAERNLSE
jgi:hypothetical protein